MPVFTLQFLHSIPKIRTMVSSLSRHQFTKLNHKFPHLFMDFLFWLNYWVLFANCFGNMLIVQTSNCLCVLLIVYEQTVFVGYNWFQTLLCCFLLFYRITFFCLPLIICCLLIYFSIYILCSLSKFLYDLCSFQ